LQAYQIFTDNVLEISLLNLATGAYRVIKRDARLLGADLEKEEDFVNYCDRLVNEKIVHEEDADLFLEVGLQGQRGLFGARVFHPAVTAHQVAAQIPVILILSTTATVW